MLAVQVNPCHFQVVGCIGSVLSLMYLVLGLAFIGPSGVHALPLAAGINVGGHYFGPN